MYDELIERLRECTAEQNGEKTLWHQAADAIEDLQASVDGLTAQTIMVFEKTEGRTVIKFEPKWIPVTERLPKEDTNCLIFIVGGEFGQLSWMSMAIFCNGVFRYDDHCGEFDQITHWMPLPEPPKEET